MKTTMFFAATLLAAAGLSANAQLRAPEIVVPSPGEQMIIHNMSDNGMWGVSEKSQDGETGPIGGTLLNLTTLEKISISSPSGFCGVNDVTDDGKIVVGQCDHKPGYWKLDNQSWTVINPAGEFDMGCFNAVTPDGKYAVGYLTTTRDPYKAYPVMYDLTTGEQVDLPNVPIYDMQHQDMDQNIFVNISPDGRYILGSMSMSYVLPAHLCSYVYDRSDDSVDFIGFTPDIAKPWVPDVPGTFFVEGATMSPNGLWVTGTAYMVQEIPGSEWPAESRHPFRYDVVSKKFEVLTQNEAADVAGFAIGNEGFLYMATPAEYPYPTAVFQQGKFIVSLEQIYKQIYNLNFEDATGYPVTGKPLHVSADGKTIVMLPTLDETYVMRFSDHTLQEAVGMVKLLADYTVYPTPGAQMSKLSSITLTFERDVQIKGNSSKITFKSEDGKSSWSPVSSNGAVADGRRVTLTFRNRDLDADKKYILNIPEGMIVLKEDNSIVAEEINVEFGGRADTPVAMVSSVPEDNSSVTFLDLSANPITVLFDADLQLSENQTGFLYIQGSDLPISTMTILANGKQMFVFPPVRQNLMDGEEYTVVIPANAVTDISGGGPNEEIVLHYTGAYIPEISEDDKYIFNEDCGTMDNFLLYDGDHLTPDPMIEKWGFTKDTPWNYVRTDENSTDMAFGSHSMYVGGGKSDDWIMTRQLHIPDDKCYLEFDAQSYLWDTADYLTVYVFEADEVYNVLNAATVERIRKEGKIVFHERLNPGESEDYLTDDWTNYVVRLPEYAGKNIYIAFLNEMEDQSAIFIDNIRVVHDMAFLTSIETAQRVVDLDEVQIKGTISVVSDIDTYDAISMKLLDSEGTEISKIEESGLELTNQKPYSFVFPNTLPLKKASINKYTVSVTLGSNTATSVNEVRNLIFQPSRKIVLEEFTGQTCPNCPQGILAIENIQKLYPGALIPVGIHTYTGDALGAGLDNYSNFLTLIAAPSGRIDRGPIAFAMKTVNGNFTFSGVGDVDPETGLESTLWLDLFRSQLVAATDVDLTLKSTLAEDGKSIDVKASVRPALTLDRAAYNIFAVILENKIMGYQQNNLYSTKDPVLGEWGAGGKYASPVVVPYEINDVVRTTWGTTYNGTAGLIPSKLVAGETYEANINVPLSSNITNKDNCEVVVMLIDAGSERVINANICELNGESHNYNGVDEILVGNAGQIGLAVAGNVLMVNGENFKVEAYDLAGLPVVRAAGSGVHAYSLNGFKGMLIVKATDAQGKTTAQKFLVK